MSWPLQHERHVLFPLFPKAIHCRRLRSMFFLVARLSTGASCTISIGTGREFHETIFHSKGWILFTKLSTVGTTRKTEAAKFLKIPNVMFTRISLLRTGSIILPTNFTIWLVALRSHGFSRKKVAVISSNSSVFSRSSFVPEAELKTEFTGCIRGELSRIVIASFYFVC